MQLNKLTIILVGLSTLWFALYPFLFIAVWLFMASGMIFGFASSQSETDAPFFMFPFFAIFPLHIFTILLQFVLMAFYLIHVIKNTKASETVRIILALGCFFMPFIAMPIYFYIYIWLETPPAWAFTTQNHYPILTSSKSPDEFSLGLFITTTPNDLAALTTEPIALHHHHL
ncbi:MAG: hypothetical protein HC797_00995 [Anaerolineales bacterium]|nr:hypothetical protein [Anaerolineales bacterium]